MLHQKVPRSPQAVISATVYYHYTFREQQYVPLATVPHGHSISCSCQSETTQTVNYQQLEPYHHPPLPHPPLGSYSPDFLITQVVGQQSKSTLEEPKFERVSRCFTEHLEKISQHMAVKISTVLKQNMEVFGKKLIMYYKSTSEQDSELLIQESSPAHCSAWQKDPCNLCSSW